MKGQVSFDLSSGPWTLDGEAVFTRASDGRKLHFSGVHGDLADRKVTAQATVGDSPARKVDVTTYAIDASRVKVTPPGVGTAGSIEAQPFDTLLTRDGAAVFSEAFGSAPVPVGESLATIAGRVDASSMLGS
ncbi:hypothetical protein [Streptomyces lavendofoliae]|uniref:hypothetical protein n=1 Tax=Streptomyces lavendofoliae TaxID=67314 RepID=UPI003D8DF9C5